VDPTPKTKIIYMTCIQAKVLLILHLGHMEKDIALIPISSNEWI
jgi:hypothetical protein